MKDESYRVFTGEKAYQFPEYPNRDGSKVNAYTLDSGTEFWFDPKTYRVLSSDSDLYLQIVLQSKSGDLSLHLLLCIDGRKLLVSKAEGASLDTSQPKSPDGRIMWDVEEIGAPFCFFTGHSDQLTGIKRPAEERFQILTNAQGFASLDQQTRGLDFLTGVLDKYGNIFSDGLAGGRELPGVLMLSDTLQKRIENGDLIDG